MCFRPPDTTSGPLICPECGKKIVSPNFRPVNCPFCKAPLPPEDAPAAPSAGGAPVAPGAPTVPGAPKPPSGKWLNFHNGATQGFVTAPGSTLRAFNDL